MKKCLFWKRMMGYFRKCHCKNKCQLISHPHPESMSFLIIPDAIRTRKTKDLCSMCSANHMLMKIAMKKCRFIWNCDLWWFYLFLNKRVMFPIGLLGLDCSCTLRCQQWSAVVSLCCLKNNRWLGMSVKLNSRVELTISRLHEREQCMSNSSQEGLMDHWSWVSIDSRRQ